jgi:ubiquitin-conjugating enzyme E2 S
LASDFRICVTDSFVYNFYLKNSKPMFSTTTFPPRVVVLIAKQTKALLKNCPEGVIFHPSDDELTDLEADILGPSGTPYETGIFRIRLELPEEFPAVAPKGYF